MCRKCTPTRIYLRKSMPEIESAMLRSPPGTFILSPLAVSAVYAA